MKKATLLICSFCAIGLGTPASAAELIGDTVSCDQVGTNSTFVCAPTENTVGDGLEFTAGLNQGDQFIGFDFNENSLLISNADGGGFTLGSTIIELANISSAFSSFNFVNSSITGFDANDVSLADGVLTLDFRDTAFAQGSTAVVSLETMAAVPEPATWLMMILGFGFVGGAMRAKRRKQNVSVSYA